MCPTTTFFHLCWDRTSKASKQSTVSVQPFKVRTHQQKNRSHCIPEPVQYISISGHLGQGAGLYVVDVPGKLFALQKKGDVQRVSAHVRT